MGLSGNISWHWLQDEPFYLGEVAVVGSIGWYDYSFAQPGLGIPRRFYEQKIAPGSASRDDDLSFLFDQTDDIAPSARDIFARWNDGRHIKLHRSDDAFVQELLAQLEGHLIETSRKATRIVVATHMLPFAELLPGPHNSQWDFAKAYLGSDRFGELLLRFPKITHALCGHSHFPAEAQVRHIRALNIGSGYRWKTFVTLDV